MSEFEIRFTHNLIDQIFIHIVLMWFWIGFIYCLYEQLYEKW